MGIEYTYECTECGFDGIWSEGGGFSFDILHCDTCANEKEIKLDADGNSVKAYRTKCKCGGLFTKDAPARCKSCKTPIARDTLVESIMYD
jgi:hypothetical protein